MSYRDLEREAVRACALGVLADPSASADDKREARERLMRDEHGTGGLDIAALRPAQVRALRKLIRGVLNGTLTLDDDA